MYICQICKKAPATIHLTDIHNNVKKEVHICEGCATEKGFNLSGAANLPQLLGIAAKKMVPGGAHKSAQVKVRAAEKDLVCPVCGTTWSQFGERGRLGCPHDYEAFAPRLRPLIAGQIAGARELPAFHVGKAPGHRQTGDERVQRARAMEKRLQQAIAEENYEAAAKLKNGLDELRNNESANHEQ